MLIIIQDPLDPGRRGAAKGAAANTGNLLQKILIVAVSLVIIIIIVVAWSSFIPHTCCKDTKSSSSLFNNHHSYLNIVSMTRTEHRLWRILFDRWRKFKLRIWGKYFHRTCAALLNCQYFVFSWCFWSTVDQRTFIKAHWKKCPTWMFFVLFLVSKSRFFLICMFWASVSSNSNKLWMLKLRILNHHRTMMTRGSQCNDD